MECHHEWESTSAKSLCDWCGSGGYALKETTSLEDMVEDLKNEETKRRLFGGLGGEISLRDQPPSFIEPPSFVETPAFRIKNKR